MKAKYLIRAAALAAMALSATALYLGGVIPVVLAQAPFGLPAPLTHNLWR